MKCLDNLCVLGKEVEARGDPDDSGTPGSTEAGFPAASWFATGAVPTVLSSNQDKESK